MLMRERPGDNVETAAGVFLSYVAQRPAWMAEAACAGLGHERWFPEQGGRSSPPAVCGYCEVREACRTEALKSGDSRGIWAGLSEQQRRRMRRTQ